MSVGASSPSPVQKLLIFETRPFFSADVDFDADFASALAFASGVTTSLGFSGVDVREVIVAFV
jgi:hypothetical protein